MLHFNIDHNKIKHMLIKAQYGSHSFYGLVCCAFLRFIMAIKKGVVHDRSFGRRTERALPE